MKKSDVTCPNCDAGFKRLELPSQPGPKGQYYCPICNTVLEVFDGTTLVAHRLTIQPSLARGDDCASDSEPTMEKQLVPRAKLASEILDLGPQQAVRIRNDSNLEHHLPALSTAIAKRRSRNSAWADSILVRASSISNHSARSTSGKLCRRPLRGGHSISKVLLVSAAGSKWPSRNQTEATFGTMLH